MYFATGVEPTNEMAFTKGCLSNASTAFLSPCTRFITPGGTPACVISSTTRVGVNGTFSDGLSTNEFPQAIANGYIHIGTMAGKLNGVMPAQTPIGCRMVMESISRATSESESPIISEGMPQATSTIWMERRTSALASSAV